MNGSLRLRVDVNLTTQSTTVIPRELVTTTRSDLYLQYWSEPHEEARLYRATYSMNFAFYLKSISFILREENY